MAIKEPQRFGRLTQSFGDFGELRRQKKPPHVEVFYTPVKVPPKGNESGRMPEVMRSVNNCSPEQLTESIRRIGIHLEGGTISQTNAETVLDFLYAALKDKVG